MNEVTKTKMSLVGVGTVFTSVSDTPSITVYQKELIEGKICLAVCPTRQRVKTAEKMLSSFLHTTSSATGIIFCLDEDDPDLIKYQELFYNRAAYAISKRGRLIAKSNQIFLALPHYSFYHQSNDDFIYKTHHWDKILMKAIDEKFYGSGIAVGDDGIQSNGFPVVNITSGIMLRAAGWFHLPTLTHLYGDNVWNAIGESTGRMIYLKNVSVEHRHVMNKKAEEDVIYKETQSKEMYERDSLAFNTWRKGKAKDTVIKIMTAIHDKHTPFGDRFLKGNEENFVGGKLTFLERTHEAGIPKVSLCMIVKDTEDPKTLRRCLESVQGWVDEVIIIYNYRDFPRFWRLNRLRKSEIFTTETGITLDFNLKFRPVLNPAHYVKWTNFSDMRNRSLDLAKMDYVIYLDTDDVCDTPWMIRDLPLLFPDVDAFGCPIFSFKPSGDREILYHNRLFRNKPEYRFRNKAHEDINYSLLESKAKMMRCPLTIYHMGYMNEKTMAEKNERNLKFLLEDYIAGKAHSLTYYGLVNCYMLRRTIKDYQEAIRLVDEYFEKFPGGETDPLTPKMWCLRGGAAFDFWLRTQDPNAFAGSKQSYQKAWHGWKHPEAAVCLAECHIQEKQYDNAIALLLEFMDNKDPQTGGISIDYDAVKWQTVLKLAFCFKQKHQWDQAVQFYHEVMNLKPTLESGDDMAMCLRSKGDWDGACLLTVKLVNRWPNYADGFNNLASYEIQCRRFVTAQLFLNECLRLVPKHIDAGHNLAMLNKLTGRKS